MKNLLLIGILCLSTINLKAELIRFKGPALSGKIISEQVDITDRQAVMICHYNLSGNSQEVMKYPITFTKKLDQTTYTISIKAMNLSETLPNLELINCAYKLIIIGKDKNTLQTRFGELILAGSEKLKMSEKELELIQNKDWLTKYLGEKLKELNIGLSHDGGIINLKNEE